MFPMNLSVRECLGLEAGCSFAPVTKRLVAHRGQEFLLGDLGKASRRRHPLRIPDINENEGIFKESNH